MSLVEFSLKRRVTVSMAAVALVIFGVVSFTRLPMNLLPDISYPTLTVETRFAGAAPGEVETLVSRPIEEVVGIVGGVQRLTSVSRPGLSQVTLEFDWNRNMDFAALDVRQKLDLLTLPRDIEKPVILRFDPANDPILRLYLRGGKSLYQLRYVAEEVVKKDLESTDGVAAIKVNGGYEEEIEVRVDEGKLSLLGLTIQDVNDKLRRENVNQAGGSLYEKEARYLVRARNEFVDLKDVMETVLVSREGRNITMADVATVQRGHKQREVITRFGGKEAVELALYKEGDANTVGVARSVRERLERMKKELPEGLEMVTGADQSRFIEASIKDVIKAAVQGGIIAIFVLLLFLKDLRSTLIIAITIPISIIATFFLMYQFGTTLNVMSLGGLALGVGMLVDGAIVVLESIHKRREKGERGLEAAQNGASEVSMAVVASILTTVVVFAPVVFVEGVAAQLFKDQAITVSISLMASLVVSLTLIPLLSAVSDMRKPVEDRRPRLSVPQSRVRRFFSYTFQRGPVIVIRSVRKAFAYLGHIFGVIARPVSRAFDAAVGWLTNVYPGALDWALRSRGKVLITALALFALSLLLVPVLGVNLIPSFSQGEFSFSIQLPEGTPLASTDNYVERVQSVLEGDTRVAAWSTIVGGAGLSFASTGTEGENAARLLVRMKPGSTTQDEEAVAARIRERLDSLGSARFKFERPSYFTVRTPIEVEVYGDSLEEVKKSSDSLLTEMRGVRGLSDVKSSMEFGNPELQVKFNREQLAQLGLDLGNVVTTVRNKVQGEVATDFLQADREIDIRVRSIDRENASAADVGNLIIAQRNGVPIYLKAVAEIRLAQGPTEIRRIGQKRAAVVSGNLSGRNMGEVAADVRQVLRAQPFPPGVTATLSGQQEEMQRSFRSLMLAGALAIFLVYLVMACEFESLMHPFVVMFTVPLGAVGTILGLAVMGQSIDVVAIIGFLILVGVVVDNAIVLIDGVNQLREKGLSRLEALRQGSQNRLRPILMTSACTVFGLLPMAIGVGEGAELQQPLAVAVIGGMTLGTFLTLIVIPVVYSLLDRKKYAADLSGARRPTAWRAGLNLPRLAVKRPVTTIMLLVSILVIGGIAASRMKFALLPEVDAPFIGVQIPYPNSNPWQIEKEIAKPVEEALSTLSGIKKLNSSSNADSAEVFMQFNWGQDLDIIRMQVSEKVDQIKPSLPAGIGQVLIFAFNTSDIPVIEARIAAEGVDLSRNYDLLEARIKNRLRRVPGVARVDLNGVAPREINIDLILDKVKAHNVDIAVLMRRLQGASMNMVIGQVNEGGLRYSVRALGAFDSVESFRNLPVNERGLHLGDIADIRYEEPPAEFGRHLDGKYAVAVNVFKESTANTVDVVHAAMKVITEDIANDPLLQGIKLFTWDDQAKQITSSVDGLTQSGFIGGLLAVAILYFFLRRLASISIVALSIPFSIIAASGVMYFMGKTLNVLSMMGLMLGVGMLVDNAIVVLESIDRHQRTERDPKKAALEGASAVAMAVTASTLTSLIVFLPLIIGGKTELTVWLGEVGIAISLALICSLVSSLTLIPLMSAHFLKPKEPKRNRFMEWLEERYVRILAWTLAHRWKTFFVIIGVIVMTILPFATKLVKAGMFSAHKNDRIRLQYEFKDFSYLSASEKVVTQIEHFLWKNKDRFDVKGLYSYYEDNGAATWITLARSNMTDDEVSELRKKIRKDLPTIPGVRVYFEDDQEEGGNTRSFAVKFFGQDSTVLQRLAVEAERRLETISGIEDINTGLARGRQEIQVRIDRTKALRLGLTAQDISDIFAFTLGGTRLRRFNAGDHEVETWLALRLEDRSNLADLKRLQIRTAGGKDLLLGDIADFEIIRRAESIRRENRKVRMAVRANYEGKDWDKVRKEITDQMDAFEMPAGYSWSWDDRIIEEDSQNKEMGINFLLALLLVYLVMASLFESLAQPFAILISIPFALPGAVWFLAATRTPFNLMAQIGLLILMGIVVNNGIVLLDHMNQLRKAGMSRDEAVLQAGRDRLRAILMTASTTVIGLLPLAIGGSTVGGLFYFPLARTVMGGLMSSTFLTLIILPYISVGVESAGNWFQRLWQSSTPVTPAPPAPAVEPV